MASAAPRRSFVDILHRGTVYFLAASTVYFSVECVRATYYIQKNKYERLQKWKEEQAQLQQSGAGDAAATTTTTAAAAAPSR